MIFVYESCFVLLRRVTGGVYASQSVVKTDTLICFTTKFAFMQYFIVQFVFFIIKNVANLFLNICYTLT